MVHKMKIYTIGSTSKIASCTQIPSTNTFCISSWRFDYTLPQSFCFSVCTPFAGVLLRQNLEQERAAQTEEQQKDDPRKKEEEEHRLRLKKATEKFFASGLRKFWLRSIFAEENLANIHEFS